MRAFPVALPSGTRYWTVLDDDLRVVCWLTIAWCVGLSALGCRWSTAQFNRDPK